MAPATAFPTGMSNGWKTSKARPGRRCSTIGAAEQVAERLPPEHGQPSAPSVFRPVMQHVAALAPRREVSRRVVGRVVVSVRNRQHHPRCPDGRKHVVGSNRTTNLQAKGKAQKLKNQAPKTRKDVKEGVHRASKAVTYSTLVSLHCIQALMRYASLCRS